MHLFFHPGNPTLEIYPIDTLHMYKVTIFTFFLNCSNGYISKRLNTTQMFLYEGLTKWTVASTSNGIPWMVF